MYKLKSRTNDIRTEHVLNRGEESLFEMSNGIGLASANVAVMAAKIKRQVSVGFPTRHPPHSSCSPNQRRDAFKGILVEFGVTRVSTRLANNGDQSLQDGLVVGNQCLSGSDNHSHHTYQLNLQTLL